MKAISLWQPWASALFAPHNPGGSPRSIKECETRSWQLPASAIGIPIAIHAAKRETKDEREFWIFTVLRNELFKESFRAIGIIDYAELPRGCIIGTVVFTKCQKADETSVGMMENAWGNFTPGRFAWWVESHNLFSKPIPYVGRQGFFDWDPNANA